MAVSCKMAVGMGGEGVLLLLQGGIRSASCRMFEVVCLDQVIRRNGSGFVKERISHVDLTQWIPAFIATVIRDGVGCTACSSLGGGRKYDNPSCLAAQA